MIKLVVVLSFYLQIFSQAIQADPVVTNVTGPFVHGESPVWDYQNQLLYFVNTFNATAQRLNLTSGKVDSFVIPNRTTIGIIVPKKSSWFEFVVGADRELYDFSWSLNANGNLSKRLSFESGKTNNQVSDGKADVNGNLWFGTLSRNSNFTINKNGGSLYRLKMPANTLEQEVTNVNISNGMAFTSDNQSFYFIDSSNRTITKYNVNINTGVISNATVLFNLTTHNITGIPDGMTIDADDNLWVAIFRGWKVLKVNGQTGELMQTVQMPVQFVTACTFGGPSLDTLFVTTSKLLVNSTELLNQPLAGSVFKVTGLGVKGRHVNRIDDV